MRLRILPCLAAVAIGGCSPEPAVGWYRADGSVPTAEQISTDQTICKGEVQKATLASSEKGFSIPGEIAKKDAFTGCMAQRGLILREIR